MNCLAALVLSRPRVMDLYRVLLTCTHPRTLVSRSKIPTPTQNPSKTRNHHRTNPNLPNIRTPNTLKNPLRHEHTTQAENNIPPPSQRHENRPLSTPYIMLLHDREAADEDDGAV